MSRVRRLPPAADQGGFVLIGVIMFVLALTILGLSLYSLSGFEVGFLSGTMDRDQAFYDASGGLDRARWILTRAGTLESVKQAIPYGDGVVYARAWYADTGESTGVVRWDQPNRPLSVRVLAVRGSSSDPNARPQRCLLTCRYTPLQLRDIYTNLFASAGGVSISGGSPQSVALGGNVWQNSHDTSWTNSCSGTTFSFDAVPTPNVADFMPRFPYADAPDATPLQGSGGHGHGHGNRTYIYSFNPVHAPVGPSSGAFAFRDGVANAAHVQIKVTGTVLWLMSAGVRFQGDVQVYGDPGSRLVIVAAQGSDPAAAPFDASKLGIAFEGSLTVDPSRPVSLILVSDGTVQLGLDDDPSSAPWISVFALNVSLIAGGQHIDLEHPAAMDHAVLDDLVRDNLLPNLIPEQDRVLKPIAGSWSQVMGSNPDDPD